MPAQTFLVRKLFTCVAKQTNQLDMLSFFVLRHLSLACGSEVALFAGELLNQFFNLCKSCHYEEIVLSCTFVIGSIILFRQQIQNKISIDSLVHLHLFDVSRVHVRGEVTLRGLEGTEATLKGVGFILDYCLLWHSIEYFDLLYCST